MEDSPAYLPGAFHIVSSMLKDEPKLVEAFRTGEGVGWDEHDVSLFEGTEKFFRPNYAANLVSSWIPSLSGIEEKLKRGARVADVGCGHGASTILMAQAYPNSQFVGFDYHGPSVGWPVGGSQGWNQERNLRGSNGQGLPRRQVRSGGILRLPPRYGRSGGAASHVREMLNPDGAWMIVEPFANDKLEDNLTPYGRLAYSASTMICTPASRAQEVGLCLGAQSGEARMRKVVTEGGFTFPPGGGDALQSGI